MSDRDFELIASLRALAPRPGDQEIAAADSVFVDAVTGRLRALPSPHARHRRRVVRRILAAVMAVLLVVVPGPRRAFARWLGIGSVRITTGSTTKGLPPAIRDLDLGKPATSSAAAVLMGHPMWTPHGTVPLGIWIEPGHPVVNSAYRIAGHYVLISELPGPGNVYVLKKVAAQGTAIEFLTVRGETAAWLTGHPHEVARIGPTGLETDPVRLAGNVLIWADQTRTIRIEGLDSRNDAIKLIESLGP